jgi:protein-ribulosamine 3-kinase
MMQNNLSVGKEAALFISQKLGKEIKVISVELMGGGCIHHASLLKTNAGPFFMKWNGNGPRDIFLREAECLKEMKKAVRGQLVIPEVIAARQVDDTPGFLVLEYLEPGSPDNDQDEMLGRGLAVMHQFPGDQFGFFSDNYCGSTPQNNKPDKSWADFFRDNRLGFLLSLIQNKQPLPAHEMQVYDRLLDKMPELLPEKSSAVLIHGDLWSGNYMHTTGGPALIDPASCYADREMEMGIMTLFGGFSSWFYAAYQEVNPLPAEWKERNRLYQLYHVLNHYYLFGGGYRHQALQIAKYYAGG